MKPAKWGPTVIFGWQQSSRPNVRFTPESGHRSRGLPEMPCAPAGSDKTAATATLATLGNRRYERTSLFVSWVERRGNLAPHHRLRDVDAAIEICGTYMRERSDKPILRAFRHVALSVRFRFLAILPAGVFFRASDFKVRTSAVVQARLLNPFFTI